MMLGNNPYRASALSQNSPPKPPKRRVMVSVPDHVHVAMEHLAVDQRRTVSEAYSEAARAYLDRGGRVARSQKDADAVVAPQPRPSEASAGEEALSEILRRLDGLAGTTAKPEAAPVGPVQARALAVILANLARAGADGLFREQLLAIMGHEGFAAEAGIEALGLLREYGLVSRQMQRFALRTEPRTIPRDDGRRRPSRRLPARAD